MDRSQKAESVAALNAVFNEVGVVVVTRNLGMTVAQSTALRTKIREAGATIDVCPRSDSQYQLGEGIGGLQATLDHGIRPGISGDNETSYGTDMFSEMRRLGIDDIVSTRLVDTLSQPNANGSYANQIISLAMASQDPAVMRDTLNHEAVHAMKAMGLFNDAEWAILQGALDPNTVLSDEERRQYNSIYGDRPDIIQEEAVARGLERYASGKLDLEGEARTVAGQKIGMLDRLGNLFKSKNMQSPADVAAAFKEGRIGRREGTYAVNNAVANDQAGVDTERRISAEAGTTQDIPAVDAAKATEAVDPNSLSSMVTLDEEPENTPDVRLSLPQKPVNTFGKEVFAPPDERGGLRRALDEQSAVRGNSVIVTKSDRAFLPGARLATRIETIDKRAGVEEASRFLKHRPIESAIAAVRNADQSRTLSANSLESGPLEIKGDGPFHGAIGRVVAAEHGQGLHRGFGLEPLAKALGQIGHR